MNTVLFLLKPLLTGASYFGGTTSDTIALNEDTIWSGTLVVHYGHQNMH